MKRLVAALLVLAAAPAIAAEAEPGLPAIGDDEEIVATRLIETPFGPVRITELAARDASHGTPGALTVTYLAQQDGELVTALEYPHTVETGSNGRMASWHVDDRFTDWPMLVAEGGGTWQGETCSWVTLTELRPTGPLLQASWQSYHATDGAFGEPEETTGEVLDIERNARFTVRYSGSQVFENVWYKRDDQFIMEGEDGNVLLGC